MVINMRKYKIVSLKENFFEIVQIYPLLAELLFLQQDGYFETKQVELLYNKIDNKEKILAILQERDDYSYFHGKHIIHNYVTDEVITVEMHEYDILVEEKKENHIIFDLFQSFSKNFYLIEL